MQHMIGEIGRYSREASEKRESMLDLSDEVSLMVSVILAQLPSWS